MSVMPNIPKPETASSSKRNERARLQAELKVKQEAFVKKERVYKLKIEEQEDQLASMKAERTEWMDQDESMTNLRKLHGEIQSMVGLVQNKTAKLVQDQESDLLKAFRHRLNEVQAELDREKASSDKGGEGWMARSRGLELDVNAERDRADKEDRAYKAEYEETCKLRLDMSLQADDRERLIKELVAVKRANQDLKKDAEAKTKEVPKAKKRGFCLYR